MLQLKLQPKVPNAVPLTKEVTTFGRQADTVDIAIDSRVEKRMISRLHAKIVRLTPEEAQRALADKQRAATAGSSGSGTGKGGSDAETKAIAAANMYSAGIPMYKVVSLGTNGVMVNRVKVDEAVLSDGDEIVFGASASAKIGTTVKDCRSDLIYEFKALSLDSGHGMYTPYDRTISATSIAPIALQNYLSYQPMVQRSTSKAFAMALQAQHASFGASPYDAPITMLTSLTSAAGGSGGYATSASSSLSSNRSFPSLTVDTKNSGNGVGEPSSPSTPTPRSAASSPIPSGSTTMIGVSSRSSSTGSINSSSSNSPGGPSSRMSTPSARTWNQRFQDALDMPEGNASQTMVKYQVTPHFQSHIISLHHLWCRLQFVHPSFSYLHHVSQIDIIPIIH
jgi:hypothetical protein